MRAVVTSSPLLAGLQSAFVDPGQWEELDRCPICQSPAYLRDVAVVEGGATAVACLDCEFGFLRRRPVRDWYEHFYSTQWDRTGQSRVKDPSAARVKVNASAADFCAEHLPSGSTVLDIGAGFGSILLAFQARGHDVCAIERSEHRAAYVRDVLGIPCSRSSIETYRPSRPINLACMNHVLEHTFNPDEAIAAVARILPDGGMIYIAVPDFWRGEYPPQTFHFVPHVSSFTVKALRRLLSRHGFRTIKSSETKDLQILAAKGPCAAEDVSDGSDDASREAFWDKTSDAVVRAFGARAGHHTLVWFEDDNQPVWTYQRHVVSGPRLLSHLIKLAARGQVAVERQLPPALRRKAHRVMRRLLPPYVTAGNARMLSVEVSGEMGLAVHIRHPPHQAPVWIK